MGDDADLTDDEFEAKLARAREAREADQERTTRFLYFVVMPSVALLLGAIWVASSAMEAAAFNRATGSNVSTWDAMWIELRVPEQTKR